MSDRRSIVWFLAVLLLGAVLVSVPLTSQTFYGSIVGVVTDPASRGDPGCHRNA